MEDEPEILSSDALVAPRFPGARIKEVPEDFVVEELAEVSACGEGDHLWIAIEKTDRTTEDVILDLARTLPIDPMDIGVAGLKDRRAVTRQWISLKGVAEAALESLALVGVRILEAKRHTSKLRRGQLRGNRFQIRVRGLDASQSQELERSFQTLSKSGLPNHFGEQRFGNHGGNVALGRALVLGRASDFLAAAACEVPAEGGDAREGRRALRNGDFQESLRILPRFMTVERHLAAGLLRRNPSLEVTVRALPHRLRSILVSAWQSAAFNQLLSSRVLYGLELLTGDVAIFRGGNTCFRVEREHLDRERKRQRENELDTSGPLPGWKLMAAESDAGAIERPILEAAGIGRLSTELVPKKALRGTRRALTVPVEGARSSVEPDAVLLEFSLPAGSYATTLLAHLGVQGEPKPTPRVTKG
jgi:tRNA pseudouridine13 synthase